MFFCIKKFDIISLIMLIIIIVLCCLIINICFKVTTTSALPITNKTIIIDAGHGLPDGGAVGINGSVEQGINLDITLKLQRLLEQSGANVILTRSDNNAIYLNDSEKIKNNKINDLKLRKSIIESSNSDIFISIHMNKFEQSKYRGAQVFYSEFPNESELLAKHIQNNIKLIADQNNKRQIKENKDVFLLRNTKIPSVLIECGFISNAEEEKLLNDENYQNKVVYAIYHGILDYFE